MPAKKRNADAKGSHSPQDRGRLACKRLYSTADERNYISRVSLKIHYISQNSPIHNYQNFNLIFRLKM
ncbi:MAG: hypothetical protein LBP59_04640 [Planctomycetaceae bacterium]|nr:hypothetical protein [Planctomycetaceae bacterium]